MILFEQPWRFAGRKLGGAPSTLDPAWVSGIRDVRSRGIGTRRLVVGGRSAGARVACRTVEEVEPDALLILAFPLHPARRTTVTAPPPTRLPELVGAARRVPTVVVAMAAASASEGAAMELKPTRSSVAPPPQAASSAVEPASAEDSGSMGMLDSILRMWRREVTAGWFMVVSSS